ncbi:MAG: hypothetical protein E7E34_00935 [Staphylococcus epidermidis]|nr:hypothetical protein [Staphylococcus epidermidis]
MKDIFNEMDYRNIPRDMLDKNIPTGRGMVKWAPNLIGFKHNLYMYYV